MGEGQEETSIVSSSGNFVIAWDFKAIKKGKYDKYEIRRCIFNVTVSQSSLPCLRYQDVVVQDQFKYGDQNDIVSNLKKLKRVLKGYH
jgi:VID27 C-terminal WD40-like domain